MKFVGYACLVLIALAPTACSPAAPQPTAAVPTVPIQIPSPTPTLEPTALPLSFTPATYRVDAEGFELDYPSGWTAVPISVIGPRGSSGAVYSPGSSPETLAAGGARVGITVYLWEPKNDLAAYVTHRRAAWDAGASGIVNESDGDLVDGRKYLSFLVKGPDGKQTFFLFTTLGEKYLEISGDGDLSLVEEIARTVRPLGLKQ